MSTFQTPTWALPPFPKQRQRRYATVHVTRQDFWDANMGSNTECAVALALKRALPEGSKVSIGTNHGSFRVGDLSTLVHLDLIKMGVTKKIEALIHVDWMGPWARAIFMRPFSFTVSWEE